MIPNLAGRVARTGCKQPLNVAPRRTPRQTLQPVDTRSIDGRKPRSTPASGLRIAEECPERGYMMRDRGALQLALGDDLNVCRNIVERDIAERLVLPIEPDQELPE